MCQQLATKMANDNLIIAILLFLCILTREIAIGACPSRASECPGCFTSVNLVKSRIMIENLVQKAVHKLNSATGSASDNGPMVTYVLDTSQQKGGIKDASRQVVAGMLYCIEFYVIPSQCAGQNSIHSTECQKKRKLCKAEIWQQPLLLHGAPMVTVTKLECALA